VAAVISNLQWRLTWLTHHKPVSILTLKFQSAEKLGHLHLMFFPHLGPVLCCIPIKDLIFIMRTHPVLSTGVFSVMAAECIRLWDPDSSPMCKKLQDVTPISYGVWILICIRHSHSSSNFIFLLQEGRL